MMIKSAFLRFISVFVAVLGFLFMGVHTGEPYDVEDPDKCVLNFAVFSDVHIEGNNIMRYKVISHALRDVKKNKSGHDAVLFLGDSTMNGQFGENVLLHGAVRLALRNEKVLTALGNHDIGNGQGDFEEMLSRWYTFSEAFFGRHLEHPYYYEVIDGYYFIVLGTEAQTVNSMYISEAQYEWLDGVLEKAGESGKPMFVFMHHPTDYTVDADGSYTYRLTNKLAAFNRTHDLFCFVGHTHMPMHLYWSFHTDDGFEETYLPCLTRLSGEKDNEATKDTGTALEVELYEDEIVLRGRDFFRSEWYTDSWEDDEPLCEVRYPLKNPIAA